MGELKRKPVFCKCGAEMTRQTMQHYIPNCGMVSNTTLYCAEWELQLGKAREISEEAYELLWDATREFHTEIEISGPRW